MSVGDEGAVGEIVDGGDLVDGSLVGRERWLEVDILCVEQVELVLYLHDAQDQGGELDLKCP